jgi:serine/threonine protein kinase
MDSCKCPITDEIFEDPVMGDDGHTYERKTITAWLTKNGTSPITRQPMNINSLRTNYTVKKMIEELRSAPQSQQTQCQFQLDVDIRKTKTRPLFQGCSKSIYEVEWINRNGPPIVLLKIDGAKANREASFYVQLGCHPHIVRTFGLVQCHPGSVMLLQECAPHGDLLELLRENGFKPTEQVLWKIFEQICDAMVCLADNGIVHGDLACRNILVFRSNAVEPNENLVKLSDFGLTRGSTVFSMVDSPSMSTMTIIPVRYAAPEILRNPDRSSYSEKSDIYSMGVLMWEACSYGQLPYSSLHNDNDVRQRKLNDERLPQPSQCNHQLWTSINECWQQESLNRPTFNILKELLPKVGTEPSLRYVRIDFIDNRMIDMLLVDSKNPL